MKKIIMFLMCCLLFISCGSASKNKIFEKDIITRSEYEEYVRELIGQGTYEADVINFYPANLVLPAEEMNQEKIINLFKVEEIPGIEKVRDEFFDRVSISHVDQLKKISLEHINQLFNTKEKSYRKALALKSPRGMDGLKAKYFQTGVIKVYTKSSTEISYVNIKNNKIDNVLFYITDGETMIYSITFANVDRLKKIGEYNVNQDVVVFRDYYPADTGVFEKHDTTYILLKPIQDGDRKILYFTIEKGFTDDKVTIKMGYEQNDSYGEKELEYKNYKQAAYFMQPVFFVTCRFF